MNQIEIAFIVMTVYAAMVTFEYLREYTLRRRAERKISDIQRKRSRYAEGHYQQIH